MSRTRSGFAYKEYPILEVAKRCGLMIDSKTMEREEVEASCPFCRDHGPGKHHLSLNTTKNIYRCNLYVAAEKLRKWNAVHDGDGKPT